MTEAIDVNDLKNTVEKLERLESAKDKCIENLKEGYAEAKSKGYCMKILKQVIKLRKKHKDTISEEDALLELYRGALDI